MAGPADISVIIPTYQRWATVSRTLERLVEQDLGGAAAEIVVVDNGSRDGSWERLRDLAGDWGGRPSLIVLREPIRGPGPARNAGVLAAGGELVLFLGDDCEPAAADLVAGHLRAHAEEAGAGAEVGVVGHISWDPHVGVTPVMRWLERRGKMLDYGRLRREPPGPFAFYTGNVSLRRSAVVEVGGFDGRFGLYGWEDHDLALRLEDGGFRLAYRPELLVHHRHRYDLRASLARMEMLGRTAHLLNRLHPGHEPAPAPRPEGVRGGLARALAPVLARMSEPPGPLREGFYRAAHFAALAAGYGGAPLPEYPAPPARLERASSSHPAVSVVVPFRGGPDEAGEMLVRMSELHLSDGDELLVADNTDEGVAGVAWPPWVKVVPARGERSPAFARNRAAERAQGDWLLLLDADCRPSRDVLDRYFATPIHDRCAAVAGAVVGAAEQDSLAARYARSREYLRQDANLRDPRGPRAALANLLVRRTAWEELGGLTEGIRCAEDTDFCWRLQRAGWRIDYREHSLVEHFHRDSLGALLVQNARYVAGAAWLNRRFPGSYPREGTLARLARCVVGIAAWTAVARFERALFKALDGLVIAAESVGWRLDNSATARASGAGSPRGRP